MINVAVIGVGNMGKHHARIYSSIKDINFLAVCDLNEELGNEIANKYHVNFYKDFLEMIKTEKINTVSICVPTSFHYKVAKVCLENKINVLLEKPIASSVKEAKELQRIAVKNKNVFMIGHIERFNPGVVKVKEMIEKKELGDITAIIARRVGGYPPQIKDANIAIDLAIHDIDIVNYLLNSLPEKVLLNKRRNHIKNREDSVELFMKYKNSSAYIQANWISPVKIRKLNVTGSEGYLEMDYITQKIEFFKSNYKKFKEASKDYSDYVLLFGEPDIITINVAKKEPLFEEISYFINLVNTKKRPDVDYAIDALKIIIDNS